MLRACGGSGPSVDEAVKIYLYDFAPHLNCILIDSNIAFVHHYGTHSRGFDAPALTLWRNRSPAYEFYSAEFESLWTLGYPAPQHLNIGGGGGA